MKAANITASSPAATFSARRRSQPPVSRNPIRRLLQGVDLLEHALRPVLRLIRGQVHLLRMVAEGSDVGCINLEARLLEALDQLRFALQVLRRAPVDRLVDRGLEVFLPGGG